MNPFDEGRRFPFLDLCAITRPQMGEGRCLAVAEPGPEHCNSLGLVHGGLIMTLADAAMGGACQSLLPAERSVVTVNMQISFLAPGAGRIEAHAHVVRSTRSLMFVECDLRNAGQSGSIARVSGIFRPVDRDRVGKG